MLSRLLPLYIPLWILGSAAGTQPSSLTSVHGRAKLLQLFCPSVLRHWLFWTPMEPEEEMTSLSSFPPPAFLILLLLFLLLPLLFLLLVLLLYYYFSFFGGFWFS